MPSTITVKGIGKVSAAPDLVVLSMGLESQDIDYEKAMSIGSFYDFCEKRGINFEEADLKCLKKY